MTVINNKFDLSIYRKPTQMEPIILHNFNYFYSQKNFLFHFDIFRLERTPLSRYNFQNQTQHYL